MKPVHVGKAGRAWVDLDLATLIDTRLLVCANSGGGKSYLLRGLAEQCAPQIPTIVLDPEGEFSTLREGIDAVLVSRDGGDVLTDPKSATLLARKLLEMRLCAIIDLSDLKLAERRRYMRLFLDAIMGVPKKLWRPTMILLDEAHQYAPQTGQSEAMESVISLMSQGRKRGFCGVLATQRLSKLHKDAAAEANNMVIGRTTLDLDLRRACDLLQKGKAEWATLQNLDPGEFFAFGPALSARGITKLRTAKVQTTHPQSGRRHAMEAPKPSARIRKVLPEFDDLPERAAAEAKTLEEARTRIRHLEREARKAVKKGPAETGPAQQQQIQRATQALRGEREQMRSDRDEARAALKEERRHRTSEEKRHGVALRALNQLRRATVVLGDALEPPEGPDPTPPSRTPTEPREPAPTHWVNSTVLGAGGKHRMMVAIAQMGDDGCDRVQLGLLAGMSSQSGTFSKYLSVLRGAGYVADDGDRLVATDEGLAALGDGYRPLPTGSDLADYWLARMGQGGKRRLLAALLLAAPEGLSRQALAEAAGLSADSGTFSKYLSVLRGLKLAQGKDTIRPAESLL